MSFINDVIDARNAYENAMRDNMGVSAAKLRYTNTLMNSANALIESALKTESLKVEAADLAEELSGAYKALEKIKGGGAKAPKSTSKTPSSAPKED